MKILLVNHRSVFIDRLEALLVPHEVVRLDWRQPLAERWEWADVVVLSGGHQLSVARHREAYEPEFTLIRHSAKPVIGVCLGCQVLAAAYDSAIERLPVRAQGLKRITMIKSDPIFRGLKRVEVYQSHRWAIIQLPSSMEGLAISANGYEIIRHKQRRQYGLQFHPEVPTTSQAGKAIFAMVLNQVKNSS